VGQVSPREALVKSGATALVKSLQQEATTLPPVIRTLVDQIGGQTEAITRVEAGGELGNRYRHDVLRECNAIVTGRYPFQAGSAVDVPLADFGRLLGYGGVFDTFFKSELEQFADITRSPWTWREGAPVGALYGMLPQFETARRIRDTFFRQGAQLPELRFTVTPTNLDASATRFTLEIDGQTFDYRHGPERSWPVAWPGPNPGVAAATFEERAGGRPNREYKGAWAWFRLLDEANIQRETDVRYVIGFAFGGHQARIRVEASSIRNPYATRDVQQFRCGGTS
jgi:type VI secretion system protein ImpL